MRFKDHCLQNLPDFQIFLPESAMKNLFSGEVAEPFDIADFETLVGELSHAIVIFPEAPGSYAETGYFSAVQPLAKRSILVSDLKYQRDDSFISMGPAKKIGSLSLFQPIIQLDYAAPDFDVVTERIKRINKTV